MVRYQMVRWHEASEARREREEVERGGGRESDREGGNEGGLEGTRARECRVDVRQSSIRAFESQPNP